MSLFTKEIKDRLSSLLNKEEEHDEWKENYNNWEDSGSDKEQNFNENDSEKEQDSNGRASKWYPLNSSNVDAVMWKKKKLYVRFKNGFVYWYADPTRKHHINIMSSASPGRYIHNLRTNAVPYGRATKV